MDLQGLNFHKSEPQKILEFARSTTICRNQWKELFKEFQKKIKNGKLKPSINLALLLCVQNESEFFSKSRKEGLFRLSNKLTSKIIVFDFIESFTRTIGRSLHDDNNQYLSSINKLRPLLSTLQAKRMNIVNEINSFTRNYKGYSFLRTMLSIAEYESFLRQKDPQRYYGREQGSRHTFEDILGGISYIIHLYEEINGFTSKDWTFASFKYYNNTSKWSQLISDACQLNDFREVEIELESFGYQVDDGNEGLVLTSPNGFEKTMKIGYIKTQLAPINKFQESGSIELSSIVEKFEELSSLSHFLIQKENMKPYSGKRHVLIFGSDFFRLFKDILMSKDFLTSEEISVLRLEIELLNIEIEDFLNIEFGHITFWTIIQFSRFVDFISAVYQKESPALEDLNSETIESLFVGFVPMFEEDEFYEILGQLFSEDEIEGILDILCYDGGKDLKFDLQYYPILYIDGVFLITANCSTNSNYFRNTLFSWRKKHGNNAYNFTDAVVGKKLEYAFQSAGFSSTTEIKYKVDGIEGDIDFAVKLDDTLLIIECKHNLHPTDSFDLRTTYSAIQKAIKQLSKHKRLIEDGKLKEHFCTRFDDFHEISAYAYAVVINSRMLHGNYLKYPIRGFLECEGFILEGLLKTNKGNYHLWQEDYISSHDVLMYFNEKTTSDQIFDLTLKDVKNTILDEPYFYRESFLIINNEETNQVIENYMTDHGYGVSTK